MHNIRQALKDKFDGGSLSAVSGGFHFGFATKGSAFPYLVANLISSPAAPSYSSSACADYDVQFSLVGKSLVALSATAATVEAVFNARLTLSGSTCVSFHETSLPIAVFQPQQEHVLDSSVEAVWAIHWTVRYTFQ